MSAPLTIVQIIQRKVKAWQYETLADAMLALTVLLGEYAKLKAENERLISELKK